jgi:8-oxo-dGTP pyrophosphatase MutT (NUDIX family)
VKPVPWTVAGSGDLEPSPDLSVARCCVEAALGPDAARSRILAFLDEHPDALHRSCTPGHLTGSGLVVDPHRGVVALLLHAKVRRWLQPGGHADGEANLALVGLREASEETGIDGLTVVTPAVDLDVHRFVHAAGAEPDHWHLDVRYVALAPPGSVLRGNDESHALEWFAPNDLDALGIDAGTHRLVAAALRAAAEVVQRS